MVKKQNILNRIGVLVMRIELYEKRRPILLKEVLRCEKGCLKKLEISTKKFNNLIDKISTLQREVIELRQELEELKNAAN